MLAHLDGGAPAWRVCAGRRRWERCSGLKSSRGWPRFHISSCTYMHNSRLKGFDSDSFLQKFRWGKGTCSNFLAMLFFYLHKWCSRREDSDQLRSYCNPPFEVAGPTWWSGNRIMMMMTMMIIVRQYTSEMRIVAKAMMVLGLLWQPGTQVGVFIMFANFELIPVFPGSPFPCLSHHHIRERVCTLYTVRRPEVLM